MQSARAVIHMPLGNASGLVHLLEAPLAPAAPLHALPCLPGTGARQGRRWRRCRHTCHGSRRSQRWPGFTRATARRDAHLGTVRRTSDSNGSAWLTSHGIAPPLLPWHRRLQSCPHGQAPPPGTAVQRRAAHKAPRPSISRATAQNPNKPQPCPHECSNHQASTVARCAYSSWPARRCCSPLPPRARWKRRPWQPPTARQRRWRQARQVAMPP